MKKIYLALSLIIAVFGSTAQTAPCGIDYANLQFFNPDSYHLPCAERGVPYHQVVQIKIYSTLDVYYIGFPVHYNLTVNEIHFDSVTGMPPGIVYDLFPGNYYIGGENACALLSGTTTADTGKYQLLFRGTAHLTGQPIPGYFSGVSIVDLLSLQPPQHLFIDLFMGIIDAGQSCHDIQAAGVNDFSSELNSLIHVAPNPSNGRFEVSVDAAHRLNGELVVTNVEGRTVYAEKLDLIGLYTTTIDLTALPKGIYQLQLKTADGIATKRLSVE